MMNLGLGFFVWQLNRTVSSFADETALAQTLKKGGVQHVCLKVSDGVSDFPGDPALEAQMERFIAAAKSAGIQVLGWGFAYGNSPQPYMQLTPETEANKLVERVAALNLDGIVIDAEEFPSGGVDYLWTAEAATAYGQALKTRAAQLQVSNLPVALCSYRFISYHRNFPFREFLDVCTFIMPQMYWVQAEPVPQLQQCLSEYRALVGDALPIIPVGSAYSEGGWSPTAQQITAFKNETVTLGLPGCSFYSLQSAYDNQSYWQAIVGQNVTSGGDGSTPTSPGVNVLRPLNTSGIVNDNNVNYRRVPNTQNNQPIGQFQKGDTVHVGGIITIDGKDWYQINVHGSDYWVFAQYVTVGG